MVCFLTSSPVIPGTENLNPANSFTDELRRSIRDGCRALFICSDPDHPEKTEFFGNAVRDTFENAGFPFGSFSILGGGNAGNAPALVRDSDLIILAGGHVPTQNRFFNRIGLRELLKDWPGVLIGISAGSMNSAEVVYAHPEEEGEAIDPAYRKFLPGLGLTKTMILPHYQEIRDDVLDGKRVFEDIAYPDSAGRVFYAIPDGSYLFIRDGREELRGEAYRISDGRISQIAKEGDVVVL